MKSEESVKKLRKRLATLYEEKCRVEDLLIQEQILHDFTRQKRDEWKRSYNDLVVKHVEWGINSSSTQDGKANRSAL